MSTRPLAAALTLFFVSSCHDDADQPMPSTLDAGVPDSGVLDGSLRDSSVLDAQVLDARVTPAEHPSTFAIRFAAGACLGDCPVYRLSIDQTGVLEYHGALCTARPGVFTKQLSASDAYSFYSKLRMAGYWNLNDRYTTVEDGCAVEVADVSGYELDVTADGVEKELGYQLTCTGISALDAVTGVASEIQNLAPVHGWSSAAGAAAAAGLFNCGFGYDYPLELSGSFVLADGDRKIGVLTLAGSHGDWSLVDCSGHAISTGTPVMEPKRWLLLDSRDRAIDLPFDGGTLGSIVVYPEGDAGISARGMRADDEAALTATPGTRCDVSAPVP